MIIGHLPAGYLLSRLIADRIGARWASAISIVRGGMAGAIAPDLDMIYVHLIDHGRLHHHIYPSHYPIVWLVMLALSLVWLRLARQKCVPLLTAVFS